MNRVIIAGYVGQDPKTSETRTGQVSNISIATTSRYKDTEKTEWHRVKAFGKTAELVTQYIRKGSWLMVEGRIQYSQYEDKETGQMRHSTDIVADRIEFGPKTHTTADQEPDTSFPPADGAY